jgi:hypothetical protein
MPFGSQSPGRRAAHEARGSRDEDVQGIHSLFKHTTEPSMFNFSMTPRG